MSIQERRRMTEQWVNSVYLLERQRSISSDSYFRAETVCDKLKKSFMKPFIVTEDVLEDLRMRMSQLKLHESEVVKVDQESSDQKKINDNSEITAFPRSIELVQSITFEAQSPHTNFSGSQMSLETTSMDNSEASKCNLVSLQSVNLPSDILLDEDYNHNTLKHSFSEDNSGKHHTVLSTTAAKCFQSEGLYTRKPHTVLSTTAEKSFRNESLYPCTSDLKNRSNLPPKIRPNKILGKYRNVQEYLETQFYLLKEDFIMPLKEGIAEYRRQFMNGIIPSEVKNLNIYHNVRILEPCFKQKQLGLKIDMGNISERVGDKDFMNGSLVLITPNNFEDIIMGIVLSTSFPHLKEKENKTRTSSKFHSDQKQNILVVQLHLSSHFDSSLRNCEVLLAESRAFYQPYFYVMKILQGMNHTDLPLREFILGCRTSQRIPPPCYLEENTEYLLEDRLKVTVMNQATWPNPEDLKLNDSQLLAFQRALSEKIVLIQGPPGTGKTYLGSKIARALLQNKKIWNKEGKQPMLLMCQTNHALDQFMELLVPVTKSMIRIGSQSKSAVLAPFSMLEWLHKTRHSLSRQSNLKAVELSLKKLSVDIQAYDLELKRVGSHGIIDLQTLLNVGVIEAKHLLCFNDSEKFLLWLEGATNHEDSCDCHCLQNKLSQLKLVRCQDPTDASCNVTCYNENFISLRNGSLFQDSSQLTVEESSEIRSIPVKYAVILSDLEVALKRMQGTRNRVAGHFGKQTEDVENRLKYFQQLLKETHEKSNLQVFDQCLWSFSCGMRWTLYRSWVQKLKRLMLSLLHRLEEEYLLVSSTHADLLQLERLYIMRQVEVVGMTTSAAARLYPVLLQLRCPIVIVEEAAEVFESHIVATVTKHCQHLILLGDHKQLRPHPASYQLSKTHFTNVSLFERLLLNKTATVNTLLTQHRMRPLISALIRPTIYTKLYDHECSRSRSNINGMKKNVFFFSHSWQECRNPVTGSYYNPQEAEMTVQFLRYLLKQGNSLNEICILTTYRQQVTELEEHCEHYEELTGVQVLTVDNFQGEESRIVILSLVRNNSRNQIGFLKTENRTCVALSRARDGLFMLGNIDLLSRNSDLWSSIARILKGNGLVGTSFPLCCGGHPLSTLNVSTPDDFSKYSYGCGNLCLYKLPCGHPCKWKCHHLNNDLHELYSMCMESCLKSCTYGHQCQKQCGEECGKCETMVSKQLDCGHHAIMPCSTETWKYCCRMIVMTQLRSTLVGVQCYKLQV